MNTTAKILALSHRVAKLGLSLIIFLLSQAWALDVPVPAPKQNRDFLLSGATLHFGDGRVAQVQDLLVSAGKIIKIGVGIEVTKDTEIFNLSGQHVYPGIIALDTQIGLSEIQAVRASVDESEVGNYNPNVRAIVAYDSGSVMIPTLRANGVLLAQSAPTGGIFSGLSAIVQLDAWNPRDARYSKNESLVLEWPSDSMGLKFLKARFDEGAAYLRMLNSSKGVSVQERDLRLEILASALKGDRSVFVRAQTRASLVEAIEFLKMRNLKGILVGASDAHLILDQIKESGFPVVLEGPFRVPESEDEAIDVAYQLPRKLEEKGIVFALRAHHFNGQYRNLPFMAGMAIGYGLSAEAALQALTLNSAKILGIEDQSGSLVNGKDANLFVSSGDIFEATTQNVSHAWIQGRKLDLGNHQKELYERYRHRP